MSAYKKLYDYITEKGHHFDHKAIIDVWSSFSGERERKEMDGKEIYLPDYMDKVLEPIQGKTYVEGFYPGTYRSQVASLFVNLTEDWEEPMDERIRVHYEWWCIKDKDGNDCMECACNFDGGGWRIPNAPVYFEDLPRHIQYAVLKEVERLKTIK